MIYIGAGFMVGYLMRWHYDREIFKALKFHIDQLQKDFDALIKMVKK